MPILPGSLFPPSGTLPQNRHPWLFKSAIRALITLPFHPLRRHVPLQKQTDAAAALEEPARNIGGIGLLGLVGGRVGDGSAGHDGRVPHVQGIPEGADEVAVDGKAGVSGFAEGDMAAAVDA